MTKPKYCKEDLIKYIFEDNLSYEKIGKIYNISGTAIKKSCIKIWYRITTKKKEKSKRNI